ncbi:MAG TPA: hypothetical protein ENJ82_11065, partial [Bacteroidetes bacterium]|nr:hypothetical protein [Bacteroidota bacterium]
MHKTKLLKLYRNLSNLERKHFSDFTASPFFNKKTALVQLCTYLQSTAPQFAPEKLEKQRVFANVMGKAPFDDQQLRLFASDLIQLLNKFLSFQTFSEMGSLPEILLLRNLGNRDLDNHFQYVLRKARQIQN